MHGSREKPLWVIVSPVYKPAIGGGAIYNDILAKALADEGEEVLVVVERFPQVPNEEKLQTPCGRVIVRRLFPFRAGRSRRDLRSYYDYFVQNLMMLRLPAIIRRACEVRKCRRAIVLVHSSFFYNPSVLPVVLRRLKRRAGDAVTLVLDVRDPLFGDRLIESFRRFDGIIACSRQIYSRLSSALKPGFMLQHIPVPFEAEYVSDLADLDQTMRKYRLESVRYILNPNGILNAKNYPLMLETIRSLRKIRGYEDVRLVTIGRSRDWSDRDVKAEREGLLNYLGPVSNEEAIHIAKNGILTLILSAVEGIPRSALESIALGKNIIVPNLPEFSETIPGHVAKSDDPELLARQIVELLSQTKPAKYPIENHSMAFLLDRYRAFERYPAVVRGAD